ncbi:hypothetical protein EUTSA_v10027041mg, partial [Eutrema salsugineum]
IFKKINEDLNDHERLQDRLEWEGYSEVKVKSDGNCQFRALADQLYNTSDLHKQVRQEIVKQLKSRPKLYKGLVGKTDFSEYVKNMSNDSVWGDEVTLKAAADVYGVKILLITSLKDVPFTVVVPRSQKQPDRVILELSCRDPFQFHPLKPRLPFSFFSIYRKQHFLYHSSYSSFCWQVHLHLQILPRGGHRAKRIRRRIRIRRRRRIRIRRMRRRRKRKTRKGRRTRRRRN